jgi:hypothetical protein
VSLWQIVGLAVALLPVALWVRSLLHHRRQGGMFDWARNRFAILEVPRDVDATRNLIYEGLLAALGTRAPRRNKHRQDFKVWSHLDGFGAGSQSFQFQLEPLGDERTRLVVIAPPGGTRGSEAPPDADEIPARIAQLDRLTGWLAEHSGGRVLETDWGKPA